MDVSGKGAVVVQEFFCFPHEIKVLVSKDLGKDELVVGLEDLKTLNILHRDFPKTIPGIRRQPAGGSGGGNERYNIMRGTNGANKWRRETRGRKQGASCSRWTRRSPILTPQGDTERPEDIDIYLRPQSLHFS